MLNEEPKQASPANRSGEDIKRAAAALAVRRRNALQRKGPDLRRWTGVVFDKRAWVGQPVILPDDGMGWIKQAQAGFVCVRTARVDPVDGPVHEYLPAILLRRYRLPEAVLLGSMKRGKRERPSAAKAAASRYNGKLPPRAHSRPRGRPRRSY